MTSLTKSTKPIKEKEMKREWHLVDLKDKVLGRSATEISKILQGKHKVSYVAYLDSGDYVIAINAEQVVVTGKKAENKIYTRYSGYPGGLKKIKLNDLKKKRPTEIIYRAVSGMLPKNKLRNRRLARLFIFRDDKHPYEDKLKTQS